MILRRYGEAVESVEPNFDARALTEVGFRRDGRMSMPSRIFRETYERVTGHELTARAEGHVHDEAEQELLRHLGGQLADLRAALRDGEVLFVESEPGADYPKTRSVHRNVVIDGENRLHFVLGVDPPLRVAVFRRAEAR